MDLYSTSLVLGAAGLGVMAIGGLGIKGGHSGSAHGGHGHAGSGHAGHVNLSHSHGHGHASNASQVASARGHASQGGLSAHGVRELATNAAWTLASPRFLFSFALGFGFVGELLRPVLGGPLQLAAAIVGGVLFERLFVTPLWNFAMRFASTPAVMLESSITDEATAVTAFDANGQGIVSLEVDGQIVQILATLRANDRQFQGTRIRAGQRVRIEDVDAERNRCTVSLI